VQCHRRLRIQPLDGDVENTHVRSGRQSAAC
jgi:hypothetical protein